MMWVLVLLAVILVLLLKAILTRIRPSRGLLQAPLAAPSTKRVSNVFGLFDTWYASHPAPHQHSHVFVVAKEALVRDVHQAVMGVIEKLECLTVCLELKPSDGSTPPFQFGRLVSPLPPLPIFHVYNRDWKEVLLESVDTSMVREREFLWRLHIVPTAEKDGEEDVALIFVFNHLIVDGQGSLSVLSYFVDELLASNRSTAPTITSVVPFGPSLETILDVRPTLGYMLEQVVGDKLKRFQDDHKFPRKKSYKNVSDITTGMQFLEISSLDTSSLLEQCRAQKLTLNTLLVAIHMIAWTIFKNQGETRRLRKEDEDFVDLLTAVSLRNSLLVEMLPGCGGNYLSGVTFGRKIKKSISLHLSAILDCGYLDEAKKTIFWDLAQSIKDEHHAKHQDTLSQIGLTAWIDEPLKDWMLRKGRENSFYGRSTVLGISNLTRVDRYFSMDSKASPTPSLSTNQSIKAVWFSQSNRDAFGPLIESCIETFESKLRIVLCFCRPALTLDEEKEFARILLNLVQNFAN